MKADGASDEQVKKFLQQSQQIQTLKTKPPLPNASCADGFEGGTFSNWQGEIGTNPGGGNPPVWSSNIITPGNQDIVPAPSSDACAFPANPILLPAPSFGTYSAKLGNNINGAGAEQLSFQFVVSSSDTSFLFTYAMVMEDPSHSVADQPYFKILMLDPTGDTIPNSFFYYVSGPSNPGFYTSNCFINSVSYYKPWTIRGVNLAPYIGQMVTLVATNADCSLSGHFGYGYIDLDCDGNLLSPRYCPGGPVTLDANSEPNSQYLWEGGSTTAALTISSPVAGDTISCIVTPWGGYSFRANYVLTPAQSNFSSSVNTNTITLTNNSAGAISCFWDFGDGNTSTNCNPTHVYAMAGTYTVCLTVQTDGCSSGVTSCSTITILSTGINELGSSSDINLVPNPASETVFIEFKNGFSNEKMDISVYNLIVAEVLKSQTVADKGKASLNVSTLPSGIYFIKIKSSENEITKKLIVSKE